MWERLTRRFLRTQLQGQTTLLIGHAKTITDGLKQRQAGLLMPPMIGALCQRRRRLAQGMQQHRQRDRFTGTQTRTLAERT